METDTFRTPRKSHVGGLPEKAWLLLLMPVCVNKNLKTRKKNLLINVLVIVHTHTLLKMVPSKCGWVVGSFVFHVL